MADSATILRNYLNDLRQSRKTGATVPETSYYGAMKSLFDAVGGELDQSVFCVINPSNQGAGIPDGALFVDIEPDDVQVDSSGFSRSPERGVIEAKPTSESIMDTARGEQVARYLDKYGQVLVTNFYQFILVTKAANGDKRISESYDLAENEREFWNSGVQAIVNKHADGLILFLQHVMLLPAPISEPKDLASALAYYARYAKARIGRGDIDLSALEGIKEQLETALGVRFEAETGDEFFRSTLVQTLFYGIFSAWVLWYETNPAQGEKFQLWRHIRDLNVPAIQELFEQVTVASRLRPLKIEELLERTADTLNRVDTSFFNAFAEGEAVQYFYEPFLEAFDPKLREQLGVWYTPPQVVQYMVARVDTALREELGIADGLLSDQVYVLDPCCGTGAYLVEVLRFIYSKSVDREGELMAGQAVKRAVVGSEQTPARIFGFELLPAPFVISHLQIGLLLQQMKAPIPVNKRAGVYLTNALTGWDEAPKTKIMFPELAKERDAAQNVKRQEPILVILGNPPYYGKADAPPLKIGEERALIEAYRNTSNSDAPDPTGQGLNDLYVRFYRMAERKITESTGRGIVCYISNYSWLDGLSHPGMRERYLEVFDSITIDSLNGDKYRTGKVIPSGQPDAGQADPSIFSTPFNREGIQVGTAIATLVRREHGQHGTNSIRYRDFWGRNKLSQLESEIEYPPKPVYKTATPEAKLGYPFKERLVSEDYLNWPKMNQLFPNSYPGVTTARDSMLVDIDRYKLEHRLEMYFNPDVSDTEMADVEPSVMTDTSAFNAGETRRYLLNRLYTGLIVKHYYRPFDMRWLYWDAETKLLDRNRSDYFPHVRKGNIFLVTTGRTRKLKIEPPVTVKTLHDYNSMDSGARAFPLYLYGMNNDDTPKTKDMFAEDKASDHQPNLSDKARSYLTEVDGNVEVLFYHAMAIMHSAVYRAENAGALFQDWPRVPLPASYDLLELSAELGAQISDLLDSENAIQGVTTGDIHQDFRGVAELKIVDGVEAPDFKLTGWGRIQASNNAVFGKSGPALINDDNLLDIYLNDTTFWASVPQDVWEYTLGGYPVLKKWLSYRDYDVLGRNLHPDEARTFMHIARRIAAILALEPELDENYASVKANIYEW